VSAGRAGTSPPWAGRVALVTGASRGIGAATARRLAARGAAVACAARATDAAPLPLPGTVDATVRAIRVAGGEALAVPTNLAVDEEVEAMVAATVDHFGRLDLLVNNAAVTFPGDLDLSPRRFDLVWRIDLRAPWLALRAARAHLVAAGGVVVNVSSAAALNAIEGQMAYGLAKAALEHLSVSAAAALGPAGVAVRCLRVDVPVASEGFVAARPDLDHSDWEPPEVAAEAVGWLAEHPEACPEVVTSITALRARHGVPATRARRPWRAPGGLRLRSHWEDGAGGP
jgi:NAD(P)-dependent dehydrogenase (short-subunit alcohol dehydrogenase family)